MAIRRISTRNIQSHRDVTIDLPETGMICFYGDNSNGKSVIVKATDDIIRGNITKPKCRLSLVNNTPGNTSGEIEYERYDGMIFLVHISLEASQCWFELKRPGETERNRAYLSSKLLPVYVKEFGFHYHPGREISLNICDSDDAVLFFKTSHKLNFDVLDSALNDMSANKSLETLELTLKDAVANKHKFEEQIKICDAAIQNIKLWDIDEETQRRDKLKRICRNLEHIKLPEIPEVVPVPNVRTVSVKRPIIPEIQLPNIIDVHCNIIDITDLSKEISELLEGRCPTCGKLIIEKGCCNE